MPSFLLLLVMSLNFVAQQARDKPRAAAIVATVEANVEAVPKIEPKAVALVPAATAPRAIEIIEAAAQGLSVQSEIDAPVAVKFWPSEQLELLPRDVAALVERAESASIETQTLAEFFRNSVLVEDWMNDDEKAMVRKFREFVVVLEAQLENPRVYLFGERERTVVIVGKVKGGFGGVVTLVVET